MKYEMIIETTEQLHALSHPLRQRILTVLSFDEMTNKEISNALKESAPKVHFHVKELLNSGIIRLTREEVKGSIIEKYYTASARSFRLSPSLELAKSDEHMLYESTFHETYRNLIESVDYHEGFLPNSFITQEHAWLTDEEIASIKKHLSAIDQIMNNSSMKRTPTDNRKFYTLSSFFHPVSPKSKRRETEQ
ncbi:helix-turn-helix domain-containing protein [Psychrobacillus sp. FJAT-51614]|uniref:Helix-turn-helix domain-containing protein n=1 Tax=Psychrobacillus mangrovi TaxID=3117745 RepID=A0ABU8F9N5_9BACI